MKKRFKKILTIASILILFGLPSISFAARTSNYFNLNGGIINPKNDESDFSIGGKTTDAPLYVDVSENLVYMQELNVVTTTIENLIINDVTSSTIFYAGDGSAAAPSYTFASNTDTGFFRSSANTVAFVGGGNQGPIFTATGMNFGNSNKPYILDQSSTATTPNLLPAQGDDNTGIGWAGADQLSLIAGGTEMLRLDFNELEVQFMAPLATGPIELEEDSGAVTAINLPVSSTPSAGDEESYCFSNDSNCNLKVYSEADGTGGIQNQAIVIESELGIGTSTPATLLDVYNATATSSIYIYSGGAGLGGRAIFEDIDGAGCTEITALDGTLTAQTVTCPTN